MPALSHHFNLKPHDFDDMTVPEAEAYRDALHKIVKSAAKKPR